MRNEMMYKHVLILHHFVSFTPTCLLGVCDLPSLGDLDRSRSGESSSACRLLSSELQREMSGESRCLRSLERPRSLPPDRCVSNRWPAQDKARSYKKKILQRSSTLSSFYVSPRQRLMTIVRCLQHSVSSLKQEMSSPPPLVLCSLILIFQFLSFHDLSFVVISVVPSQHCYGEKSVFEQCGKHCSYPLVFLAFQHIVLVNNNSAINTASSVINQRQL